MTIGIEITNCGNCDEDKVTVRTGGEKLVLRRGETIRLGTPKEIKLEYEHKGIYKGELVAVALPSFGRHTSNDMKADDRRQGNE